MEGGMERDPHVLTGDSERHSELHNRRDRGAINSASGGLNSLIQKVNKIPKVSIDPVGRVSLGGRNPLDVGAGTVQNESMSSRMARVRNRGNRQLRSATETARARLDRFAPTLSEGPDRPPAPENSPGRTFRNRT